jgi:hypothetical protein
MEIGRYIDFHSTAGSTADFTYRIENTSNGNLSFSGNITATGTVTANSDISLKENIKPLQNCLNKVLQLTGVEFDRIDMEDHQIGLIAQEVEKIIPDVIYGDEIKSIAYPNLVAVLIEAIKELNQKVDKIENKN